MMLRVRRSPGVLALATALLTVSAAHAAFAAGDHGGGYGHAMDIGQPGEASAVDRTVEVTVHDNYYEPERIEVTAGEIVRFQISNAGGLVHEFNIGAAAMHAQHQEEMMMMMVEHGVINGDHIDHEMMKMTWATGTRWSTTTRTACCSGRARRRRWCVPSPPTPSSSSPATFPATMRPEWSAFIEIEG